MAPPTVGAAPPHQLKEDLAHILAICETYTDIRKRMLPGFKQLCQQSQSNIEFEELSNQVNTLTQFILDPSSFNLKVRINMSDPILPSIFRLSRDYCNAIHTKKMTILKATE